VPFEIFNILRLEMFGCRNLCLLPLPPSHRNPVGSAFVTSLYVKRLEFFLFLSRTSSKSAQRSQVRSIRSPTTLRRSPRPRAIRTRSRWKRNGFTAEKIIHLISNKGKVCYVKQENFRTPRPKKAAPLFLVGFIKYCVRYT
jgi:hypothetical protein